MVDKKTPTLQASCLASRLEGVADLRRLQGDHDEADVIDEAVAVLKAAPQPAQRKPLKDWQPIETAPKDGSSYLIADCVRGFVAPVIRGVIHNNPGTRWDWEYGEQATHWMPLPDANEFQERLMEEKREARLAEQPAPVQHPDDAAVDRFAASMKDKLAKAREKGRSGWERCAPKDLSRMLREHVEKGDPRDVANFCMMLWNLGAGIAVQQEPEYIQLRHKEEDGFSPWGQPLDPKYRHDKWAADVEMRLLYTSRQPAQPEYDYKDLYEKEKRRSAMWLAKYEEVAGPAPKAIPMAQPELTTQTAPVQQEPVLEFTKSGYGDYLVQSWDEQYVAKLGDKFYTTPPQRTWVGLTDEEIDKTHEIQVWDARRSYARAIETKLKEKNT